MSPSLVLLPAMLCDDDLYTLQTESLRDLVEARPLVVAAADMTEAVARVLQHAPPRFVLAGTSYGGSLALEVALAAPDRVIGLWLMGCNPGAPRDPEGADRLRQRVQAGEFSAVVEELGARSVFPAGPNAAAAREAFRTMARRLGAETFLRQHATLFGRPDRRGDLARIECPTLLTWGCEDAFSDVGHASLMASRIPNADLVVLDACGHLPTLEQPTATTGVARTWLARIEARCSSI
jgi:pimeloyl-ACP methyl ester carboxylesterase